MFFVGFICLFFLVVMFSGKQISFKQEIISEWTENTTITFYSFIKVRLPVLTLFQYLIINYSFSILKISMWEYNLMVNNIVRSKYIFVENNKIEILFSNYIFGLTFQSPSSKMYLLFHKNVLASTSFSIYYLVIGDAA